MEIKIVKDPITKDELKSIAREGFGDMVKAVVDVRQGIMALGGELHADEEVVLTERAGSKREDVWGVNLDPISILSQPALRAGVSTGKARRGD